VPFKITTMKKIFLTLLTVLGFYSISFAQQSNFEWGVNVGLNDAYITHSNSDFSSSDIARFNVGLSGEYYFNDAWGLKVKAIYDQKGWGNGYYIDAGGNETDGVDYHLNYITVPVLAAWHFGYNRNWYLNFGPYIGFLTSANVTDGTTSLDVKDQINSIDGGFSAGLGYKFQVSKNASIFLEFIGESGVANIAKGTTYGSGFQTQAGSFNVGLNF
jgi:hypothetical protein